MYTGIQVGLWILLVACPASLLAGRLIRSHRFPWWLVLVGTAVLSTLVGYALDIVGPYAHFERADRCLSEVQTPADEEGCLPYFYHVGVVPLYWKWVVGMVAIAFLLPFYWLVWRRTSQRRNTGAA
jgi:H+/Cl- antiporter ClcA